MRPPKCQKIPPAATTTAAEAAAQTTADMAEGTGRPEATEAEASAAAETAAAVPAKADDDFWSTRDGRVNNPRS